MIYVCRVDTGTRHIFDLADGIENVGSLSMKIESQFKIDKSKQILLISGGEVLDDYQRKFYGFGFGCEESPIYLIDKSNVEKSHPPVVELPLEFLSQDMRQEIQSAISLKPSFLTIQQRAQLTHKINELDKSIVKICQSYYDDQYWQYQGYLTLIANLDEFLSSFQKKVQAIHEQFEFYLKNSDGYKDLMKEEQEQENQLQETMQQQNGRTNLFSCFSTQSIPNLQSMQSVKAVRTVESNLNSPNETSPPNNENVFNETADNNEPKVAPNLTLLDWIKSTDPNNKLNSVIDETNDILNNLEKNFKWNELNGKITKLTTQIENSSQMREIEGLTKRLDDLKGFLIQANKFLTTQNEINEGLQMNHQRAVNLRDETILHDLCRGHEKQLEFFRTNHSNLIEIANKISKAKLELIRVVHSRLHWIMQIQKQVADYDFQIQIYFKQLKRFNQRIKLMEQIKKAPSIYIQSTKETLRRLKFSKTYKSFARLVGDLVKKIYDDEMKKRQNFDSKVSANQHFVLNHLFRGLGDKVELFINDSTLKFDDQLPLFDELEFKSIQSEIDKCIKASSQAETVPTTGTNDERLLKISSSSSTVSVSRPQTPLENENEIASDDETLAILNKLIDVLLNKTTKSSDAPNEPTVNASTVTSLPTPLETTSQQQRLETSEIFKSSLYELKLKLNETKSNFNKSKLELNIMINKLIEFNKIQYEQKANFYSKIIENLENNSSSKLDDETDQVDKEFFDKINSHLNKTRFDYETKINDLKQNIENIKKNLNGEKQIQFNEAIKKVSSEKDKQIEELKTKQIELMNRIYSLEKELTKEKSISTNNCLTSTLSSTGGIESTIENNVFEEGGDEMSATLNTDTQKIEDLNETKWKWREVMLKEKIRELEKQLSMLNTLPVTNNFYETVQLNSCNKDDLVLAVYSEEHSSYKIIYKTSNYLHFVHSTLFKNCEHKLAQKVNFNTIGKSGNSSNSNAEQQQLDELDQQQKSSENSCASNQGAENMSNLIDCSENSDKHSAWFIGKVLFKEFCIAKKVKRE